MDTTTAIITTTDRTADIDDAAAGELSARFGGELLRDGDPGYDAARAVYNGMFSERRPGLIARCRSTADVATAVRVAREHDLVVAVRGGGHSIAGFSTCDGGLVIDLSPMKAIHVDPERRTASAQPGVVLGELDAATQAFGLATPLGFVSQTGIAGLTLNGGIGMLGRLHGLSCDNLIGAEVVLASGEVIHASETEHADLLWGLRGGGGNFGIVTSFEYRLHEVSQVHLQLAVFPLDAMPALLRQQAAVTPSLPDEALVFVAAFTVPEDETFPSELHGRLSVLRIGASIGDEEAGTAALAVLADGPEPDVAMAMTLPFVDAQQFQDADMPDGRRNYWKSGNLDALTDGAVDALVTRAATMTSPHASLGVLTLGGAISRVGEHDTAYTGRQAAFQVQIDNIWIEEVDDERQIAWSQDTFAALEPHFGAGAYLNFNVAVGADEVEEAYGPNFRRLQALKDRYDPTNLFHRNQNVPPSGS